MGTWKYSAPEKAGLIVISGLLSSICVLLVTLSYCGNGIFSLFLITLHISLIFGLRSKEIKSAAIKWREERSNIQSTKANANSKLDCIMHTTRGHPRLEFGAIEVSTDFTNTGAAKWLSDSSKLIISLHSMAGHICDAVDHDKDTVKALQFIAFIHASLFICCFIIGLSANPS